MNKLSNIADLIEEYILRRLAAEQSSKIELRRTEVADEIACAPSQISYVLNTRFTLEKGYSVESRRGLGGFIRIAKVPMRSIIYRDIMGRIGEDTTFDEIKSITRYLTQRGLVQNREAALVLQVATFAYERLESKERSNFIRSIFMTLVNFS